MHTPKVCSHFFVIPQGVQFRIGYIQGVHFGTWAYFKAFSIFSSLKKQQWGSFLIIIFQLKRTFADFEKRQSSLFFFSVPVATFHSHPYCCIQSSLMKSVFIYQKRHTWFWQSHVKVSTISILVLLHFYWKIITRKLPQRSYSKYKKLNNALKCHTKTKINWQKIFFPVSIFR